MNARCEAGYSCSVGLALAGTDRNLGTKAAIQAVWTGVDEVQVLRRKNIRFASGWGKSGAEPVGSAQVENLCKIWAQKFCKIFLGGFRGSGPFRRPSQEARFRGSI